MAADKLPAIQFYPGDWKKDPAVQALDLEHKGAWIELLLLAHDTSERGRLVLPNGAPIPDKSIAKMLGIGEQKWKQMRSTLLSMGVASEDENGVLYNRRMVRDSALRRKRAEAGRIGGSKAKRKQNGSKEASKPQGRARAPAGASSSSSVAVSTALQEKLSNVQQFSGSRYAHANGAKQRDGIAKAGGKTATARAVAAEIIHQDLHLGQDVVELELRGGRVYREDLDTGLKRWDRWIAKTGIDPDELNVELELVRFVENFDSDEPITTATYFGKNRHETRTLCEAERLKRQPPSRHLPPVELPSIGQDHVIENVAEKQADARRRLAALQRAAAKAEEDA